MADSSEAPRSTVSPSASKAATPARSNPASPKSKTASPRSKTASPRDPGSPEVGGDAAEIEADDVDSLHGGNPVTDDQLSSYTASLSSSVLDYPVEHGRTYHAFRAGAYYAPNDEGELDRLDFLSTLVFRVIGQPYLAPIEKEKIQRVLDIGTGTGIWACEIGEELPHAEVIGNDLSANQTTWVPPNVKFEVDDVESPWVGTKFDFIFCRAMAGAIQDWPKLARRGWVEFQDWDLLYRSDDGTITDKHESLKMVKIFIDVCRQIGREACPGPLQEQLAREAGFVNIVHQKFKVPIGPWAKDPYYKDLGTMNLICVLEGLEAFYLRLLTGVLGWTREEVLVTLATVRNELKSGTFHAHMELSKTASPTVPSSPLGEQMAHDEGGDIVAQQTQIEVDQQVNEGSPIPDDQLSVSAYTKSLSSSVVDYPTEHGRRYHAFRHGAYYGPNDEAELDRLDFLSDFLIKVMEGKLYHAPIDSDKVHRILDIGTGTGIWAVQIADEFPNAEVIGNDLSPVQMEWVPPNVKFEVDDVESPWIGPKYDFIFSRTMAGAIADWPQLARNVFENTNPGGWAEFQDWDIVYHCDDGTLTEDTYTMKMDRMFLEACQMIGRDPCPGPQLDGWLREAGFVNIRHKMFKIPIGTWPKDAHLKDLGHMNVIQIMDGLEAYNLRLFTTVLGWTQVEAQVLFAEVRKEMKSNRYHGYTQFHVAYGQVPEAEAEAGTVSPKSPGSPQAATEQATQPEPQQTHIEIDEGYSDSVSIPDEQLSISGYTASVTSSVLNYPTENGRRYHAFRHGTYYGPNDEDELDRLDFNSSFLIKLTENKLYHAPLQKEKVHRILDVGTGTGIWAVEISELFPNAEVIGNDLSPVQTTWVPPNVKFEVDDVESTWVAPKYDFIYSRFMAGAIADWPKLVKSTFANANPGGWVEFQDWDLLYRSDDDSINDDHYSMKMDKMFMECSRKVGRDPQPGPQLEQWMRDVGLVNIHHKKIKAPLGTWPKDPYLRELGHMNMIQALDGLEAYNLRLYTSILG
ncbi:hypothetical protein CcaCcLH18_08263 [Colletotrichum camelliae]|nr:hypothetical protein CcaCcLH18_08263 [Colletotrichum camelliae]